MGTLPPHHFVAAPIAEIYFTIQTIIIAKHASFPVEANEKKDSVVGEEKLIRNFI